MNKIRVPCLWLLFFLGIFVGSLRKLGDLDVWFQLMAGRHFLRTGQVPHTDFFLYPGNEAAQIFGGWGFGAIVQKTIELFGPQGASFLNAGLWSLSFLLGLSAAFTLVGKSWFSSNPRQLISLHLVATALFFALSFRMALRAESTLVLFWMGGWYALSKGRASGRYTIFLIVLPMLVWTESWLHTGGFLLLALLGICYFGMESAELRRAWRWRLLGSLGACLCLPILNPNGAMQAYVQLFSLGSIIAGDADGLKTVSIIEYISIWDPRAAALRLQFGALVLVAIFASIRRWRIDSWFIHAFCWLCVLMGALHVRGIGLAAMVLMVPAFCSALQSDIQSKPGLDFDEWGSKSTMLCIGLSFCPWGWAHNIAYYGIQGPSLGFEKEVRIIKSSHPNGARIFTVEEGPWLVYALGDEQYLVSNGGHSLIPNIKAMEHEAMVRDAEDGWAEELDAWSVDFVCVPFYRAMPGQGSLYWIASSLSSSARWRLHDGNSSCRLFERTAKGFELSKQEVKQQTLKYLDSLMSLEHINVDGHPDLAAKEIAQMARSKYRETQQAR